MTNLVPTKGTAVASARIWTDEERHRLLVHMLNGLPIDESAVRMSAEGEYIPAAEAVREVMRHGGVWPFIRTYRPDITREEVLRMQDLYYAHRGDSKIQSSKHLKMRDKIVRLSQRPIQDEVVEARFAALVAAIADRTNVNTVPFVFVIRAASCSERDAIFLEAGDVIPTLCVRFELPRRLPRKRLERERELYLLLLARVTQEVALFERGEGKLRDALRAGSFRRLKLFVTNYRRGKGWEHILVAETSALPEILFLT